MRSRLDLGSFAVPLPTLVPAILARRTLMSLTTYTDYPSRMTARSHLGEPFYSTVFRRPPDEQLSKPRAKNDVTEMG